ncbi:5079_t:CDS:2, partial [Acaulospora colombiana]
TKNCIKLTNDGEKIKYRQECPQGENVVKIVFEGNEGSTANRRSAVELTNSSESSCTRTILNNEDNGFAEILDGNIAKGNNESDKNSTLPRAGKNATTVKINTSTNVVNISDNAITLEGFTNQTPVKKKPITLKRRPRLSHRPKIDVIIRIPEMMLVRPTRKEVEEKNIPVTLEASY